MQLYAQTKAKRGGRPANKGDNKRLDIALTNKGVQEYNITYTRRGLKVSADGGVILETNAEGVKQTRA